MDTSPPESDAESPDGRLLRQAVEKETETEDAAGPDSACPFSAITIQGYRVLGEIHRGGQGIVYKAVQTATKRIVALKVLLQGPFASPRQQHRFDREIDLLAGLKHPNIVTLYDSGVTGDHQHFFAMEYVHGRPLEKYVAERHLDLAEILQLFRQVCSAVNYAHQNGVIHRDLKPGNIRVDSDGVAHVLDFGLAKSAAFAGPDGGPLTLTGEFMGTLSYASPEQTMGDPALLDTRSDVYSLGVILFELLVQRLPYAISGPIDRIIETIRETPPQRPSTIRRDIDDDIETILLKTLAKDKEHRYQSVGSLADDIALYLDGKPIAAKRESASYVVYKQLHHWSVQHRIGAAGIAVSAVFLMLAWLSESVPLLREVDQLFDRAAQKAVPEVWSDDVIVVSFDDRTHAAIPALAETIGHKGVSRSKPTSWRSLHGALMQRLANARPKVVVWDINFRTSQPQHDPDLIAGITALQECGAKVIVGMRDVDLTGRPVLSPPVAASVDGWGWITLWRDSAHLIRGVLLAEARPPHSPTPSLSVAAFAAARRGAFIPTLHWDGGEQIRVAYARHEPDNPRIIHSSRVDRLTVTETASNWQKGVPDNVDCTHRYALYTLTLAPSTDVLAAHTVSYRSVFEMDESHLRDKFSDKIVLVGDNRTNTTSHPDRSRMATHDGAQVAHHSYMHAAAICDLLNQARFTRLTFRPRQAVLATACIGGLMIGWGVFSRFVAYRRLLVFAALGVVTLLVLFWIAKHHRILISPTSSVLALWLSAALGTWFRIVCGRYDHRTGRLMRTTGSA